MQRPIDRLIEKFGGLTAMSRELGHRNPTTVQGWRDRGEIPVRQIPQVLVATERLGIAWTHADFFTDANEAA